MEKNSRSHSSAYLYELVDRLTVGVIVFDGHGQSEVQNHMSVEVFGPLASISAIGDPSLAERIRGTLMSRTPAFWSEERRIISGEVRWIEHRVEPAGSGVLWTVRDITHDHNAEEALRQSEQRFAIAFRSNPAGLAISRLSDGRFLEVNEETCRIYGHPREAIIGRTSPEIGIISEQTREFLVAQIASYHRLRNHELEIHGGDGVVRTVMFSWDKFMMDEELCMIATIIDVTELRKMESLNLRLQRMESIGALASGIVHDLNNLLGPIMLSLGALRKAMKDERSQHLVDMLETNSKRAADLAKQILTFARGTQTRRAPVSLSTISTETISLLRSTFSANIRVEDRIPKVLPKIHADPTQIHQVLLNLFVNARDAMPEGGTITVNADVIVVDEFHAQMFGDLVPGPYVKMTVEDTGSGIPHDVIGHIFDPFFTTKEPGKGTGIGLATVHSILKAHAGTITVASEVQKGTVFTIYLPVHEATEETADHIEVLAQWTGAGELIMVVDDDAIVREVARVTLTSFGYQAVTAVDGADAVSVLGRHPGEIRVVLTDMDMPVIDGQALAAIIRRMDHSIAIIGSSGTADTIRRERFSRAGIDSFLSKPYTAETLLKTIKSILTKKE